MKSRVLHGALVVLLVLLPATPLLCEVCFAGGCELDQPPAQAHHEPEQAAMADHCDSMNQQTVAETVAELAIVDTPHDPELTACCETTATSKQQVVLTSTEKTRTTHDAAASQNTQTVRVSLQPELDRGSGLEPSPPTGLTPLYTQHSSLLL